jgi:16S rRNA (cytosine1402-N4)-methyltransferase
MTEIADDPFAHAPVMRDEVVATFSDVPPGVVGGGHTEALLDARDDLSVLGLDRDQDALDAARDRLERFGDRVATHRCRFDDLDIAMAHHSITELSGALFDLGVSSPQLDRAERGFSYRHDGPLDMRMDADAAWSADDVVNGYDERSLTEIISKYGDERFARRIARAIVEARPIESTHELAEVVTTAIPAAARRRGGHPAKRTFQAIRIEVNGELEALPDAIDKAIDGLVVGGRIGVLSYHSGEDRIVKGRLRQAETGGCECPADLPCVCGAIQTVRLVRGVAKRATADEVETNRRASSVRYRVAEKIEPTRRAG